MFPLLVYRLTQSEATVGLYGTVSLVAATAAQLATGRAVDRVGARVLVVPLCVAILLCSILAALLHTATLGLFVTGTLWSMFAWGLSTTVPPLMRQLGRGVDDGRVVALMHTLWSMGMLSGMIAAGELIELTPRAPFLFAAGCPRADLPLCRLVLAPHRDAGASIGNAGLTPWLGLGTG